MLAVVCPGQGSQTPGMLSPWLELPGVADQLTQFSEASKTDLIAHGTQSDAETIRDTAVAQPLIVASALIAAKAVFGELATASQHISVTAGHSVGEFAAAAVAGAMPEASAVELVSHRARLMALAAAEAPTGMAAVVGGVPEEVFAAIEAAGLVAANVNSAGQVVAAGTHEALDRLAQNPPARARVMPLKVAGAFHTHHMDSAHQAFAPIALDWHSADPAVKLLSNSDGKAFTGGAHGFGVGSDVIARLTSQIVNPVRWDLTQATLGDLGITGLLELAPGGVLTGIAKRSLPGVELLAIKSVADVDAAREFVAAHSATAPTVNHLVNAEGK